MNGVGALHSLHSIIAASDLGGLPHSDHPRPHMIGVVAGHRDVLFVGVQCARLPVS